MLIIMLIHKCEASEDIPPLANISSLYSWACSIGIKINPKLRYPTRFLPGYLGTQAVDSLSPHEVLITVPNSAMLTYHLSQCPDLEALYTDHPDFFSLPNREHEDYRMLSYLLLELSKGRRSFWHTYLKSLPSDPETITEWNEKELLELQDPDFVGDALVRRSWNIGCCKELTKIFLNYPGLFSPELVSLQKVHWCWLIMTTRCFGGGLPYTSLIPVADFFNHSNGPTNYYYGPEDDLSPDTEVQREIDSDDKLIDETDCVKLTNLKMWEIVFNALGCSGGEPWVKGAEGRAAELDEKKLGKTREKEEKKIKSQEEKIEEAENMYFKVRVASSEVYESGSQVTICYGKYSNRMLLTNYGFAIRDNLYNYCRVKLPLRSILSAEQLGYLNDIEDANVCLAFKFRKSIVNLKFLGVLRQVFWNKSLDIEAYFEPCSMELEEKVVEFAIKILNEQLEEFETTVEEDIELIGRPKSARHLFAVFIN